MKATILGPVVDRVPSRAADALTAAGVVLGLGAAVAAAWSSWWLALLLFLAGRMVDGLDGEVARRHRTASDAGGYADIVADTVVYAAIPIGASVGSSIDGIWPVTAVLLGSFYVNTITWAYLAAILEKRSVASARATSIVMPAGLVEGAETIAFFTVMLLVPQWLDWTMGVMAGAVGLGAAIRFVQGRARVSAPAPSVERSRRRVSS